jgi:hypothetical protein
MRPALLISLLLLSFQTLAQNQSGDMGGMDMPHTGSTNNPRIGTGSDAEAIEAM